MLVLCAMVGPAGAVRHVMLGWCCLFAPWQMWCGLAPHTGFVALFAALTNPLFAMSLHFALRGTIAAPVLSAVWAACLLPAACASSPSTHAWVRVRSFRFVGLGWWLGVVWLVVRRFTMLVGVVDCGCG